MRFVQFLDMNMGLALLFVGKDDEAFIRRNFGGTFHDSENAGNWYYMRQDELADSQTTEARHGNE